MVRCCSGFGSPWHRDLGQGQYLLIVIDNIFIYIHKKNIYIYIFIYMHVYMYFGFKGCASEDGFVTVTCACRPFGLPPGSSTHSCQSAQDIRIWSVCDLLRSLLHRAGRAADANHHAPMHHSMRVLFLSRPLSLSLTLSVSLSLSLSFCLAAWGLVISGSTTSPQPHVSDSAFGDVLLQGLGA